MLKLCVKIRRDEHGEFRASCPSLPGCVSNGPTEEHAKKKLDDAIRGYLASIGDFVPENIEKVMEYQS